MPRDIALEARSPIPDPAGPANPKELNALFALGLGLLIGWSGLFYLFGALLLVWETEAFLTKEQLSLGLTAAIGTSALVAPIAGRFIDNGNGRKLLGGGALIGAVGLVGLAFTTNYYGFLSAWVLIGVAQGFCLYEPCFAFLARVLRQRARRSIVLVGLLGGMATLLVYPTADWIAHTYDWRITVLCFASLMALVAAPLMYFGGAILEPASCNLDRRTRNRAARLALRDAKKKPVFWCLLISFALLAFTEGMILAHGVPALVALGQEEVTAIFAMALVGPFQGVARAGLLLIGLRGSALILMVLALIAMSAGVWLISEALKHESIAYAFAALFGIGYGMTAVLKPIVVSECLGYVSIGAILGFLALPYYFALAAGPYLGWALWSEGGYSLVTQLASLATLLSLLALVVGAIFHRHVDYKRTEEV